MLVGLILLVSDFIWCQCWFLMWVVRVGRSSSGSNGFEFGEEEDDSGLRRHGLRWEIGCADCNQRREGSI